MALKIYCDRCKKEISDQTKKYRKVYFFFGEDDGTDEWDFCPECFLSVKRSMINNLADYETIQANTQKPALDVT